MEAEISADDFLERTVENIVGRLETMLLTPIGIIKKDHFHAIGILGLAPKFL